MANTISIGDFLDRISNPKKGDKLSVYEIWDLIKKGSTLEDMGFSTEAEKKEFIENNPYDNI